MSSAIFKSTLALCVTTALLLCAVAMAQVEPRLDPAPDVDQQAPLEDLKEAQDAQTEQVEGELEEVETKVERQTDVQKEQAEDVQENVEEKAKEGVPANSQNVDPTEVLTPADTVPAVETAEIPPEAPITRAYMARRLIKTLGFTLPPKRGVSEFPFYRDVPRADPSYTVIELARERGLMTQDEMPMPDGFFGPKKVMTYTEVFHVLERSLTGNKPPVDASRTIIETFEDSQDVSDELAPVVAKLVLIGVLRPEVDKKLLPQEEVIREKLDVLLERTAARLAIVRFRMKPKPDELPDLGVGQIVMIEPTSVILREGIAPGDTLYFAVAEDTAEFAKGGRFRGKVVAKKSDDAYTVELSEYESTEGEHFQTATRFDLTFPHKEGFFAPGDHVSIVTGNMVSPTAPVTP